MSDSDSIDLSDLRLTPKWVSDLETPGAQQDLYKEFERRESRGDRNRRGGSGSGGGQGKGRRGPGGGGGGGRGDDHFERRQGGTRGRKPQDGRYQGGGGGPAGKGRGGRGGGRPQNQRPAEPPIEGVEVFFKPVDTGIDALAKTIKMTGRAYSVFDLGKLVLGGRDRYMVTYRKKKGAKTEQQLILCSADGSLWMSRAEAIRHFIESVHFDTYYKTEKVSIDPPKGNFSVVAVCGMSGTILGPPNHHAYPSNVARLHTERFSSWPLEKFKSRIRMERDDAIIQKWMDEQSTKTQYVWLKGPGGQDSDSPPAEDEATVSAAEGNATSETPEASEATTPTESEETAEARPDGEPSAENTGESDAGKADGESAEAPEGDSSDAPADTGGASDDSTGNTASDEAPADQATEDKSPEIADSVPAPAAAEIIETRSELERHINEHYGDELFPQVKEATVPGDIPGTELSPNLLALLRWSVDGQRRFPMQVMQELCNMFQQRGLKFFKEKKKATYVARARPRPLSKEVESTLTDRLRKIVSFIRSNPRSDFNRLVPAITGKPLTASEPRKAKREKEEKVKAEAEAPAESTTAEQKPATAAEATPATTETTAAPLEQSASVASDTGTAPAEAKTPSEPKPQAVAKTAARTEPTAEEIGVLKDLRWLVIEGYVTEFSNGELRLVEPRERPAKKKAPSADQPKEAKPGAAPTEAGTAGAAATAATAGATESASTPASGASDVVSGGAATTATGDAVDAPAPTTPQTDGSPAVEDKPTQPQQESNPVSNPASPTSPSESVSSDSPEPGGSDSAVPAPEPPTAPPRPASSPAPAPEAQSSEPPSEPEPNHSENAPAAEPPGNTPQN